MHTKKGMVSLEQSIKGIEHKRLNSLSDKSLVVISNRLVEARYRLTVEEQKLIRILASTVRKDDSDFKEYTFTIRDLATAIGIEHNDPYRVLKKVSKRLITRVLEFDDVEEKQLIQAPWLASVNYKYGKGIVSMTFSPALKPLMLYLQEKFTKYELGNVLRFKCTYSVRFYEIGKETLGKKAPQLIIEMDSLRGMLRLGNEEYTDFRNFKRRIMKPAADEVNKLTDISMQWQAVRGGRGGKVKGIALQYGHNNNAPHVQPNGAANGKTETPEQNEIIPPIVTQMMELDISAGKATSLLNEHDVAYLEDKLEQTQWKHRRGEIKESAAAYFIWAVQENHTESEFEQEKMAFARRRRADEKKQVEKRVQQVKDEFSAYKFGIVKTKYDKLSTDEQQALHEAFVAAQPKIRMGRRVKWEEVAFDDESMNGALFRLFVANTMKDHLPSLDEYLAQQEITLSDMEQRILRQER